MIRQRIVSALLSLILAITPAFASQTTLTTPGAPLTMAGLATFLNNGFATVATNYSGPTAPAVCAGSTACIYQYWLDTSTTPTTLRINDGASWVPIGTLDATGHIFNVSTSDPPTVISGATYTFGDVDRATLKVFSNAAAAITLPQAGSGSPAGFVNGWFVDTKYTGSGAGTITPTPPSTIDGLTTLPLSPGRSLRITSDGTNFHTAFKPGTPTTTVLGGVFSKAAVASNWLRSLGTDGNFTASQPAASDLSNGVVGTGAVVLQVNPPITAPTITGGTLSAITGLGIRSTGAAFDTTLAVTEVLTAGRTLTITLNDANRTLNLGGNLTTAAALTQVGAFATTITVTGITNSTLPAGTHTIPGLDVSQTWQALQLFQSGNLSVSGSGSGSLKLNCAATCGTSTLTFPGGTTDFSATGGTSQFVKQASIGAALTVVRPACADLSDAVAFCNNTDAANLTGTVNTARIAGSYTGITGVGTLTAGGTGAGFTVALTTSTITGNLPCSNTPALTGDVTTSAGNCGTTLANIPTTATMAGKITATNIVAPSTPASGKVALYTDSTDKRLHDINDAGAIGTTVVAKTATTHQFVTAISVAGVVSQAQPAASDLSNGTTGAGASVLQGGPALTGLVDLQGAIKLSGSSSQSITTSQNDYNPSSAICSTIGTLRMTTNASLNITGLAGGVDGCRLEVMNVGANPLVLTDSDSSSSAVNRMLLGGNATIAVNNSYELQYDGTSLRWRASVSPGAGGGGGGLSSLACGDLGINCSSNPITTTGTIKSNFARSFLLGGM